jgi:polar amino acid transport system substrate-binding protein
MMKNGCLALIAILTSFCTPLWADVLTVCIEDNVSTPFYDSAGEKLKGGLLTKLVNQVASNNHLQTEFIMLSWPRCMEKVASGEINAVIGLIYTPERAATMAFPPNADQLNPKIYLWQARYPFFVKKGQNFNLAEIEKAPKYGIGTPIKYVTHHILEQKKLLPLFDYDLETGLSMVAAGRLDAYVIDFKSGMDAIEKLQLQNKIEATQEALLESYWHIAFNPDYYKTHQQQVDKLWAELHTYRDAMVFDK